MKRIENYIFKLLTETWVGFFLFPRMHFEIDQLRQELIKTLQDQVTSYKDLLKIYRLPS